MFMRILVVEDDAKISAFLSENLQAAGFEVDLAFDGLEASRKAYADSYDLVLLDLMLPKKDGLSLVAELRAQGVSSKILILSAKRQVDDRVMGLQSGADDYLIKPFAYTELLARCQALLRRPGGVSEETRLTSGELCLNLVTREVFRAGRRIELRAKEFTLLEYFVRHANEILSKSQILKKIWHYILIHKPMWLMCWSADCATRSIGIANLNVSARFAEWAMFLKRLSRKFSFRLAAGFCLLFLLSSAAVFIFVYNLFSYSLKKRDHEIIQTQSREFAARYNLGGAQALKKYVDEKLGSTSQSPFMVRLNQNDAIVFDVVPPVLGRFFHDPHQMEAGNSAADGQ